MHHAGTWYTHRWNSTTSLRMILAIIPRVPRWTVPAIAVVTTAICIGYMRRERRAARRNLRRITDARGVELQRRVWSLFYNFSRFMVGYCDLKRLDTATLAERVEDDGNVESRVRDALSGGAGVIVLTAHLGNWEIAARLLSVAGAPVNVAMRLERDNPAERWLRRIRERGAVRVLDTGGGGTGVLALRAALARNEVLAMQGDRAAGAGDIEVELFAAPYRVPAGPFLLAYGCRAPLVPAFVVHDGWWRWRSLCGEPVRFPRTGDRRADLRAGAEQYAHQLERVVRRHPDQWFNFYDLWPGEAAP